MKALKTKVILSAAVLLFALVATIGSTFAWFTTTQTNEVQEMTLNIGAANNLLIRVADDGMGATYPAPKESVDLSVPANYSSYLTLANIQSVYGTLSDYNLFPVTALQSGYASKNAKALNTMVSDNTNLVRNLVAADSDKNNALGNFIEFKAWVYLQSSDGNPKNIVLNNLSVTLDGGSSDVVNAVRIAVWANDDHNGGVYSDLKYTYTFGTDADSAFIFGKDPDYDFAFISTLPGYSSDAGTNPINSPIIGTTEFNSISQITLGTGGISVPVTDSTVGSTTIASLVDQTPTLLTFRIYIEGWDAETTNNIVASAFDISFDIAIGS